MSVRSTWREVRFSGAVGGMVTALLGLVFLFYPLGDGLTNLSYDLPFAFRPQARPTNAVIVYMDEASHEGLEQPYEGAWDRRLHAQLLDRLKAASVRAVAFDVLFDTTTTNDAVLVDAAKAHGRVAVAVRYTPVPKGPQAFLWESKHPFEELRRVAAVGVVESPGADEVVRAHYAVDRHSTNLLSLAWKAAELSAAPNLGSPLDLRYINYYGPPGTIPSRSYLEVLSNSVPSEILSNKVVFVGALIRTGFSAAKGTDNHPTPYTRWTGVKAAGVEINATAFLNLVRGDWLRRLSPMTEFLLVWAAGLLFGFLMVLWRPLVIGILAAASIGTVFAFACVLMWGQQIWFPWAIISGVQIPCAAVCAILYRSQLVYRQKQTLEEQLAQVGAQPGGATVVMTNPGAWAGASPAPIAQQKVAHSAHSTLPEPHASRAPKPVSTGPPAIPDCTLIRRIGAGAYGEVWLGTNVIGAFRAIKIVHRSNFREDRPYEREFEGIRHFDPVSRTHPGLVQVLHVGRNDNDGYFYYVMELADDASGKKPFSPEAYQPKSLSSELEIVKRLKGEECISLGVALADALDCLHGHNLIHRDIKPSNTIFVNGKPKLADIGLITQIGEGRTFVGTEGFFPPEGPGSPSADIFSLGKLLYVAWTGLRADQFPELPPDMPEQKDFKGWKQLNQVLLRACEHSLKRRYATAQELKEDLLAIHGNGEPGWRPFRKKRKNP